MPLPLNLFKAYEKGELILVQFPINTAKSPPANKNWLILYGAIGHITTGASVMAIRKDLDETWPTESIVFYTCIAADMDTGVYPLFSLGKQQTQESVAQAPNLLVVTPQMNIRFTGGAAAWLNLTVLEWTT